VNLKATNLFRHSSRGRTQPESETCPRLRQVEVQSGAEFLHWCHRAKAGEAVIHSATVGKSSQCLWTLYLTELTPGMPPPVDAQAGRVLHNKP